MPNVATRAAYTGTDADGNHTYGAPVALPCNVVWTKARGGTGESDSKSGRSPDAVATIIVPGDIGGVAVDASPRDRFVLSSFPTTLYADRVQTWTDQPDGLPYVHQIDLKESA